MELLPGRTYYPTNPAVFAFMEQRHGQRLDSFQQHAMLRDDFSRLAGQVADIMADRGGAAWQRARSGMDDVFSDAQDKGREAVDAMREVSDKFVEAVDESIKNRPYTTLAMALGLGFLFGSTWRR